MKVSTFILVCAYFIGSQIHSEDYLAGIETSKQDEGGLSWRLDFLKQLTPSRYQKMLVKANFDPKHTLTLEERIKKTTTQLMNLGSELKLEPEFISKNKGIYEYFIQRTRVYRSIQASSMKG